MPITVLSGGNCTTNAVAFFKQLLPEICLYVCAYFYSRRSAGSPPTPAISAPLHQVVIRNIGCYRVVKLPVRSMTDSLPIIYR